jgi:hypothetical protein
MTKKRINSAERNAPRATIGNEGLRSRRTSAKPTPGPDLYKYESLKSIGDESSVKVPFTTAIRPISAHPGQIKRIHSPGPSDYRIVETTQYMKRSTVIPNMTFTTAGKELESKSRRDERAKSPGPSNYNVNSVKFLKKSPSATFGNTKRTLMAPTGDRATSPGPSDYVILRSLGNGPR